MTAGPSEHLDVLVVGAGLSGIAAGHYLRAECPWAGYAIFEARDAIGGTWDLFRYPGIRSDSDMFTLGYSFRPWSGHKSIADGDDILAYIRDTAAEEGIDGHIRFHHRIVAADWRSEEGHWRVTAENTATGETVVVTAGFLFSCTGYYRYDHGHEPHFAGREDFEGRIVHPQQWPEGLDYADRRVVVIGSGATAVTLVPALARDAAHVTMLQRSPTYLLPMPDVDPLANLARRVLPRRASGPLVRWYKALTTQGSYVFSRRFPGAVRRLLRAMVAARLPKGYDVDTHFAPSYDPWDQRLCVTPHGDLFRAISAGDASVVTDHVDRFTPDGIALRSGKSLPADIIVTATGLELLFLGGMALTVHGASVEPSERLTYQGMMLEDVPNLAMAIGYTNASWTLKCDLTCQAVTRILNRLHDSGARQAMAVNRDGDVRPEPLLGLSAGYIQRSAHLFPRQGSRAPWRVYQSYLADYRALRLGGTDEALEFSNPAPATQRHPVSA
ncbi:MAG: NAD(P)/FAD-dependent oxidoreductase [Microthrixaceae bacterium]